METIAKIICLFMSIFVIVNGCYTFYMPPSGDEPLAITLIAIGIIIGVATLAVAWRDSRSEA
jgi:hypothetical protein